MSLIECNVEDPYARVGRFIENRVRKREREGELVAILSPLRDPCPLGGSIRPVVCRCKLVSKLRCW